MEINLFNQVNPLGSRLHRKVILMMIGVGVLPIVLLGIIALYSLNTGHRVNIASIETNLINQKTEEINAFFNDLIGTFELRVTYEQKAAIELSQQHFLLRSLLEDKPNLEEVSFINLKGQETARHDRFSPNGVPHEELQDQSRSEKFLKAKDGKIYLSQIYPTLRGPMITIAAPVFNRNNVVVAVLAGEINLGDLQKIVERSRLGSRGYLYVVDQDGYLIAHSRQSAAGSSSTFASYLTNPKNYGFLQRLLAGENFLDLKNQWRYKSFWGERVVGAGTFLNNYNLGIVAEWPVSDADRVVNIIRNQILAASFAVLVLSVLLSAFLANRIVQPIKKLEAGTKLIAEGKFDQPVNIVTNDEIEDLGLAFNKMMEGLKRLEELKNEFVFIAAHELRTPVTAIKGYISMVFEKAEGRLDAEIEKFLAEVKKASERLNNLVNDLLQIARSEAGRFEIKVAPTDIIALIKAVLSELKVLADEKSINIIYDAETLPKVLADPVRLTKK